MLRLRAPQGSLLGPVLFVLYMHSLGSIISSDSIHFHLYSAQLYLFLKPDDTYQLVKLLEYLKDLDGL